MSVALGFLAFNGMLLVAGYALIAVFLRRLSAVTRATYAGLALLLGAGTVGGLLAFLAVLGLRPTPIAFVVAAALVVFAGVTVLARTTPRPRRRRVVLPPVQEPEPPPPPRRELPLALDLATTAAAFGVAAFALLTLVAAFRSTAWLDDAWFLWLPRGLMLREHGLDPAIFAPNPAYAGFPDFDYPLWWSILTAVQTSFLGELNMHAVNGQLTLLVVAFVASVGRLLWGLVRPEILWPGLLLLLAAPELIHQTQSGGADLLLAAYISAFALGAALWLGRGSSLGLTVAAVAAVAALAIKKEGLVQVLMFATVIGVAGLRRGRSRLLGLAGVVGFALATHVPWLLWLSAHDVPSRLRYSDIFDAEFLSDRSGRIEPSASYLLDEMLDPGKWLVILPLAIVLSLAGALRTRRLVWLAPTVAIAGGFALLVGVYWVGQFELEAWLGTSARRVVDTVMVFAAISIPVLGEALARSQPAVSRSTAPEDPTELEWDWGMG
ncbi:MAG TPA: hypothetical protein VM184_06610 [Gaiellaceae bacterium]|nr:hypothetical protein [Gaiellaceae bacterium]